MSYRPAPGDQLIRCDCCGREVVAVQRQNGELEIVKRRHGRDHRVVLRSTPGELLARPMLRVAHG